MNFKVIWDRQSVPEAVLEQCMVIAERALECLVAPGRAVQNVTEWAKREQAWAVFKAVSIPLTSDFREGLLSSIAVEDLRSDARARQRTDSGIQQQMAVLSVPPEEWQRLWEFVSRHRLGTSAQLGIVDKLRRSQLVPSDRQVSAVLALVGAARSHGYEPDAEI
jgi:hypothetical protein